MAGSAEQAEDSARSALVDSVAPEVEPEVVSDPAPWDPPEAHPSTTRRQRLATSLAGAPGVALVAVIVGIAAAAFASQHDVMMLYADARSHLTIARRLIDGPNHGIIQLGTVWLPVPHIVLIPFVASPWLWHTGLAAIPIDIAYLVIEALAIFSLVGTIARVCWAAWIAATLLLRVSSISVMYLTAQVLHLSCQVL